MRVTSSKEEFHVVEFSRDEVMAAVITAAKAELPLHGAPKQIDPSSSRTSWMMATAATHAPR